MSNPRDEFAGDFWTMIENPGLQIPGAWLDEDLDDEDGECDPLFREYGEGYWHDTWHFRGE